jgi:hypothetical protein
VGLCITCSCGKGCGRGMGTVVMVSRVASVYPKSDILGKPRYRGVARRKGARGEGGERAALPAQKSRIQNSFLRLGISAPAPAHLILSLTQWVCIRLKMLAQNEGNPHRRVELNISCPFCLPCMKTRCPLVKRLCAQQTNTTSPQRLCASSAQLPLIYTMFLPACHASRGQGRARGPVPPRSGTPRKQVGCSSRPLVAVLARATLLARPCEPTSASTR